MTHFKTFLTTASTVALLGGSSAFADVTAQQVWEDWKENLAIYGQEGFTFGDENLLGGTLTVSDVAINFSDDLTDVTADFGDIIFVEQGDGTVQVTMANAIPMSIKPKDANGGAEMLITNSGLLIVAGGSPDAMTYDVQANQYGFRVDELTDESGAPIEGDLYFTANNFSGQYTTKPGDIRTIDYAVDIEYVDLLVDLTQPNGTETIVMSGKINNISGVAAVAMPDGIDMSKPDTMFVDGFAASGNYSLGESNYIFDLDADGSKVAWSASMGSGAVSADINAAGLDYNTLARDLAINVQSGDLPFPVDVSLSEYGIGMKMPFMKTEEPTDFGFSINLTDLAVNEEIWMMADPSGALSHDPATLKLDLGGKAKLFFDLMDPEQADAMAMGGAPGELHALTLNELQLKIAGALLTGTGGFTFDNTKPSMVPGMPQPEGEITVNLKGANQLIDSLVAMGLLPEDQAMMGRMMMGMFARTVGDDELSSTIEINDQGHILANGQRIQ